MSPLIKELLVWIETRPRTYQETMEAWRSNCPRHSTWEDASIDGLVQVVDGASVTLTDRGRAVLDAKRQSA